MNIDRYNARVNKPICSEYVQRIEYLLGLKENYEYIKNAKEYATISFYSGESTRFRSVEELEEHFNDEYIKLIKDIQREEPKLYDRVIKMLDEHLRKYEFFNKDYGIITPKKNTHLKPEEYFKNYLIYKKVLEQILSVIKYYGL